MHRVVVRAAVRPPTHAATDSSTAVIASESDNFPHRLPICLRHAATDSVSVRLPEDGGGSESAMAAAIQAATSHPSSFADASVRHSFVLPFAE